ncbi:hypothetical protein [Aliiruegeria lutimaris]|uniref:Uncharacterized protein n=1 Tax=Aliiruegeria lutimaris TaxID=571298 RepID=A0A1G9IRR6_9RHOB|nr:hypothetical protein [Aliiruegeria lutimaris]SDL27673.1 hypothetical protein SAMN04488026_10761 [Aliiruegeria lutimaris]
MIPLIALLALAGCATPRESCLSTAQRELATIDKLIAETQANLARGYALQREYYTTSRVTMCAGSRRNSLAWNYCTVPETRVREEPVAIDRATEERKLRELKQTRKQAEAEAQQKIAYCEAKFPLK